MCRTLLKSGIEFWNEDVKIDNMSAFLEFQNDVEIFSNDFSEASISSDTKEVAYFVAGFIAKNLESVMECIECSSFLLTDETEEEYDEYFRCLDRGGLSIPTQQVAHFVFDSFAVLDSANQLISKHTSVSTRRAALYVLEVALGRSQISCNNHSNKCTEVAYKKIVNIFYNNKQKLANASHREDSVQTEAKTKD